MKLFLPILLLVFTFQYKGNTQNQETRPLLIPTRVGDLWGASDTLGNIVIKPKFPKPNSWDRRENCPPFYAVGEINKVGIINLEDELVFDTIYEYVYISKNAFLPIIDNKYAVYSLNGNQLLPPSFDYIQNSTLGVLAVQTKTKKFGLLKITETDEVKWLLDTVYQRMYIRDYHEPYMVSGMTAENKEVSYYIDNDLELTNEIPFFERTVVFEDQTLNKQPKRKKNKYKKRITGGKWLSFILKKVETKNGWRLIRVRREAPHYGNSGLINKVEKDTLPEIFEELEIKSINAFPVKGNGIFKRTEDNYISYHWAFFKKGNKIGAINCNGQIVIEPKYEELGSKIIAYEDSLLVESEYYNEPSGFMIPFKLNGKWGVMNHNEEFLVPPKYDGVRFTGNHRIVPDAHRKHPLNLGIIVKREEKFGVVSVVNDTILVPIEMDKITSKRSRGRGSRGFLLLEKNGLFGFYDKKKFLEPIFPEQFLGFEKHSEYPLVVFYYDKRGKKIKGYGDMKGTLYFKD